MAYRILVALVVVMMFLNIFLAKFGKVEILGAIDFYMLPLMIISFLVFEIQKRKHPEIYKAPSDGEAVRKKIEENTNKYGFLGALGAEVFEKDMDLLIEGVKNKPRPKPTFDALKVMVFAFVFMLCFGLFLIFIFIYTINLQEKDMARYSKFVNLTDRVVNSSIYKSVNWAVDGYMHPSGIGNQYR